eukprot:4960618-Pyramimonas_sp.AAC.1
MAMVASPFQLEPPSRRPAPSAYRARAAPKGAEHAWASGSRSCAREVSGSGTPRASFAQAICSQEARDLSSHSCAKIYRAVYASAQDRHHHHHHYHHHHHHHHHRPLGKS